MSINLTFKQGTNPDTAQVQVQNKLQLATPLLPQEVQQQGIRVTKATRNFLLVVGFISTDGSMTNNGIANYVAANVQDPISRTSGVGDFTLFGAQYEIERASCRERVCQYVVDWGGARTLKKKKKKEK